MPSKINIEKVKKLQEKAGRATAILFADYRGLSVAQVQDLKAKIAEFEAELTVAKNSLIQIALRKQNLNDGVELEKALTGPTAVLFCYSDEVAPIKAVYDFSKENGLPEMKAGFLGNDFLNANRLSDLSKLPSKLELQAKAVGSLNAPIYGFVNVLAGNMRKLVYVIEAVRKVKQQ